MNSDETKNEDVTCKVVSPSTTLSEIDKLRIELMNEKMARLVEGIKAKRVDIERIEAQTTLSLQRLQSDITLIEKKLLGINESKRALLSEFSERYGVNFNDPSTSYNTKTGVVTTKAEESGPVIKD
jgi:tRNA uridine 5-carbamoylmethylation protein Kti12